MTGSGREARFREVSAFCVGFLDPQVRAANPHIVDCREADASVPGAKQSWFEREEWCKQQKLRFEIDLWIDAPGEPMYRRFRFADENDAMFFRLRFG